jgi:membrane protease subunit (stomatin/prohibitin family)
MPGLLKGMAKTAVVAGTAQATRNAVNRHSAEKNYRAYSEAQQQVQGQQVVYTQPQQAAPPPKEDPIAQLERLGALKNQGVLTEEEFQAQKAKILGT